MLSSQHRALSWGGCNARACSIVNKQNGSVRSPGAGKCCARTPGSLAGEVALCTAATWIVASRCTPPAACASQLAPTTPTLTLASTASTAGYGSVESLLSDAIAYVTDTPQVAPPANKEDGKTLLNKLVQERDRIKKEAEREQKEKEEKNKLKQQLQGVSKEEASATKQIVEELKATQAEALKKLRDEEAARHQQEVDARRAAENKARDADAARVRAENERKEAERARDRALRRRDTLVAAAGGAGLGVIISFASEVFRFLGGPTIIAGLLRTPGYVVGKTFRMIEWDLQGSPREPDGAMVRVTMPLQLTRNGMRHAIAKAYDLETAKSVKQFAQTFAFNGKIFYERLESKGAVTNVPDGTVLVWTQVSPSVLQIPTRSDQLPIGPDSQKHAHHSTHGHDRKLPSAPEATIVEAIRLVCQLSRQDFPIPLPTNSASSDVKQEDAVSHPHHHTGSFDDSSSTNGNGAHVMAVTTARPVSDEAQQPASKTEHPALSTAWLLNLKDPSVNEQVQEAVEQLGVISPEVESEMMAAVANSDPVLQKLFVYSGNKDVFSFVSYVRAHLVRTGRLHKPSRQ